MRALAFTICLMLVSSTAGAYAVNSAFGAPCHEQAAFLAYTKFAVDLPDDNIPLPDDDETWQDLADFYLEPFDVPKDLTKRQRFVLFSLIVGVRSPDTDGHGLLDLQSSRKLHAAPEGQYLHALRAIEDNGDEGNANAVEMTRQEILNSVSLSREYGSRSGKAQLLTEEVYLDFYGVIDVEVWGVAFHLGRAMHTLQDSFSHTLRTPDTRRIQHVMNYVDAIGGELDEAVDGIAHSESMDRCEAETAPLYNAAVEATLELTASVRLDDEENVAVIEMLDRWVTYEEGCNSANDYCGSKWVAVAREKQTRPYLDTYISCGSSTTGGSQPVWVWPMLIGVFWTRRRR